MTTNDEKQLIFMVSNNTFDGEDDKTMTDAWLAAQMRNACVVASVCHKDEDAEAAVLRGFANRVLMKFGKPEVIDQAMSIPFTITL